MVLTGVTSKAIRKGGAEPPLAPGTFRIYNMRFCPWAEKAMIYVAAKGIDAEVINLNVTDKPEWYFSKHYQGKAPAIEHDGKIVIDSGFIPEYLDDAFPETRILPTDPYEKAQQKLLADRLTAVAHAVPCLFAVMRDRSLKDEKQAKVFEVLKMAEELLTDDFYAGSTPGFPDYVSFPFFEKIWWSASLDGVVDLPTSSFPGVEQYPKLTRWFSSLLESDAVQSVTQSIRDGAEFMNAYATHGELNYDLGL
uniref:Glutathione-dependent dehydroascorbate reductase n=1 Tax=Caenorhabditis tropicalis TaxID=1561998 RepID=A0A1I7TWT6_9PELO